MFFPAFLFRINKPLVASRGNKSALNTHPVFLPSSSLSHLTFSPAHQRYQSWHTKQ